MFWQALFCKSGEGAAKLKGDADPEGKERSLSLVRDLNVNRDGGYGVSLSFPLAVGNILVVLVASNPQQSEVKVSGECQRP